MKINKKIFQFCVLIIASINFLIFISGCYAPKELPATNKSPVQMPSSLRVDPTPQTHQKLKQFKIKIDDVRFTQGQVKIFGTTDLPDGAGVIVNFDVPKGMSEDRVGSDERVVVTKGKFQASLTAKPIFPKSSPQVVEVLFTPRGQNPEITLQTGPNGEYLAGDNVSSISGIKVIEVVRTVNLPIK